MLQRKQQALVQGSISVLLARASPEKVHPDFPAQPRPTRIAEVTRARPAAQQIVAALSQVFLPADGTPAQSGANVLTTPQHSYVQLLHLLRTFVGKEHRVVTKHELVEAPAKKEGEESKPHEEEEEPEERKYYRY